MQSARHPSLRSRKAIALIFCAFTFCIVVGTSPLVAYTKAEIKEAEKTWKLHDEAAKKAYRDKNLAEAKASLALAVKTAEKFGSDDKRLIESLGNFADVAVLQGEYAEAASTLERVLAAKQKKLGEKHKEVYRTMAILGSCYGYLRQHEKAEPLVLKSLENAKKRHGSKDEEVGRLYDTLGMVYLVKRDHKAAEDCFRQALAIAESQRKLMNYHTPFGLTEYGSIRTIFGPNYNDLAAARNSLALVYRKKGDIAAAEKLFIDAIESIEKISWKDSPSILGEIQNLRNLYLKDKNYLKAEQTILRENRIRVAAKQSHPSDSSILISLYSAWEDNPEAPTKAKELMEPMKRYFNVDTNQPIASLPELIDHLVARGDAVSASMVGMSHFAGQFLLLSPHDPKLFEAVMQVMALFETTKNYEQQNKLADLILYEWDYELEKNDIRTLTLQTHYAGALIKTHKLPHAEVILSDLVPKLVTVAGSNNIITARALWHQGELKRLHGDTSSAFSSYESAFAIYARSGDTNDHFSIDLLRQLVDTGVNLKKDVALDYLTLLLPRLENKFGLEHAELIDPLIRAGDIYKQKDEPAKSANYYARSLNIQTRQRGADNIVLIPSIEKLMPVYAQQGKTAELEALYKQRVAIYEKTFGPKHPGRIKATQDYAAWLRTQDREDDAAKLVAE